MIQIKRNLNTVLTVQVPSPSSDYVVGESVTLAWEQPSYTALQVGDYITYDDIKHKLNQLPTVKKLSTKLYQYNAVFQSPIHDFLKAGYMLFDNTATIPSGEFSLTGTPETFLQLLVDNLNRVFGANTWAMGQVLEAEVKTITFSNENCHAVLMRLADEFETEFSLTDNAVNLIETTNPANLTLEYGSTLYDIERKSIDSSSIITRLYPFGGSKNIAANYRGGSTRLLLPDPLQYLEANVNLYGIIEGQKTFDDIYPRLGATAAGTVTSIGADIFTFTDANLDFNLNDYLMPGTPAKLRFLTGDCAGYDLEIASFTNASKTFKVIVNEDDKGFKIPDGLLVPAVGNKYVLLDVIMPTNYITAGELEVQDKGQSYLNENSIPKVLYTATFSSIYAKLNFPDIRPGDLAHVYDADLGIDTDLRVIKVTKGITDAHNVKIDLSNTVSKSTLTRIAAEIAANTQGVTKANEGIRQVFARNWRNVEELSTMIDTLRTDMLFVGNVQGQFDIAGTLFTPNYQNDKNKFYATAGTLRHKTIPTDDNPGTWTIPAYAPTITGDTTPYYLYAKCNRANGTGVYHLAAASIVYDSDPAYYYFLVGVLSSVVSGARTLQTTYGFTQITGKQLVTGKIQSQNAKCYFDLEANDGDGEIGGNIKFKSGETYKEVGAGISEAVDAVQIGGRNLILNSKLTHTGNTDAYGGFNLYPWLTLSKPLEIGKSYTISWNQISGVSPTLITLRNAGYESVQQIDVTNGTTFICNVGGVVMLYFYAIGQNNQPFSFSEFQLEIGNKKTDYDVATEDINAAVADAKLAGTNAQNSANAANSSVSELNTYVDGAFKDGVIDTAEAQAIDKLNKQIDTDYNSVINDYNVIYVNSYLEGTAKTDLLNSKINLVSAKDALQTSINTAIADGKTTPAEKADVNAKFTTYSANFKSYQTALSNANKAIQTKLDSLSTDKVNNVTIGGRNFLKNSIQRGGTESYLAYDNDISYIFDNNGVGEYMFSFDIKSPVAGNILFYGTPGLVEEFKYLGWAYTAAATPDWQRISIPVQVYLNNPNKTVSSLSFYGFNVAGVYPTVRNFQIEKGNKSTAFSRADEDIAADILTAQTAANAANSLLADIASDSKLTPNEKQIVAKEWAIIEAEFQQIYNQSEDLGNAPDSYDDVHYWLSLYLSPLLADMNETTPINQAEFKLKFTDYYAQKTLTLNGISNAIKNRADAAQIKATALDYLKAAIAGSTTVNGGLVLGNMLGVKNALDIVTAGMNGISTAGNDIRFWAGTTIENMANAPFKIYEDGTAEMSNVQNGSEVSLSRNDLKTLAAIKAGMSPVDVDVSEYTELDVNRTFSESGESYPQAGEVLGGILGALNEKTFTLDEHSIININAGLRVDFTSVVEPFITSIKVFNVNNGDVVYQNNVNALYSQVGNFWGYSAGGIYEFYAPKGTYKIKVEAIVTMNNVRTTGALECDAWIYAVQHKAAFNKTIVAPNGIVSISDINKYIYISQDDANYFLQLMGKLLLQSPNGLNSVKLTDTNLEIKGTTDTPGVLATGSVASGGTHSNKWGAKVSPNSATKGGTGIYNVPHTINHSNYTVMVTLRTYNLTAIVASKSNTSIQIQIRNLSLATVDADFDYMIIGTN